MSRRFGRNQRRRAREALAEAATRHEAAMTVMANYRATLRTLTSKVEELEEVIAGVRLALGDYTVALDPEFYLTGMNYRPVFHLPEPLRSLQQAKLDASPLERIRHVVAGVLDIQVSEHHLCRHQHVRLRFADVPVAAYAIEERTLRTGGREFVERHLARVLATALIEHFQPGRSRRHG